MPLFPCPSCSRHVLAPSEACPFCRASLPSTFAATPARAWPTERVGRAAMFGAVAVAGAATLLGCGDDDGGSMALYGAPPEDSGMTSTDTGARDSGPTPGPDMGPTPDIDMGADEDAGMMALYGGPPDAGADMGGDVPAYGAPPEDAGMSMDGGGGMALYGAPAVDAGNTDDGGGAMALYGAPAPEDGGGGAVPLYGGPPA